MTDLAALAKLAQEATPGPWHIWDRGIGWEVHTEEVAPDGHPWCPSLMDYDGLGRGVFSEPMAAYIAAASPDVVLALVRVALAAKEVADSALRIECEPDFEPWTVHSQSLATLRAALEVLR